MRAIYTHTDFFFPGKVPSVVLVAAHTQQRPGARIGAGSYRGGIRSVVAMLDQWIQTLKAGDCLAERDLKKLCLLVSSLVQSQSKTRLFGDGNATLEVVLPPRRP